MTGVNFTFIYQATKRYSATETEFVKEDFSDVSNCPRVLISGRKEERRRAEDETEQEVTTDYLLDHRDCLFHKW